MPEFHERIFQLAMEELAVQGGFRESGGLVTTGVGTRTIRCRGFTV
jgi:hypothetical protein